MIAFVRGIVHRQMGLWLDILLISLLVNISRFDDAWVFSGTRTVVYEIVYLMRLIRNFLIK